MSLRDFDQFGHGGFAGGDAKRAAGSEGASGGQRGGRGNRAYDGRERLVAIGFEGGNGAEQAASVRVRGVGEEFARGTAFDNSSGIHDADAVGDAADHGEVVRDEEHG